MTTYRDAGVDIDAGDEVVRRIRPLVRETFTPGVLADIGAFGAFFELDLKAYEQPVLVSSVDGVGTKLIVAHHADRHDTVGQDLVNHCVNDIAVCGADPLYFLDYYATGKLVPEVAEAIVRGFAVACRENGCALVGGETAEMPDLYGDGEYDLAGTIVGVVEKSLIIDGSKATAGDVLLGLPSTGLHTNGYSLARRVLLSRFSLEDRPPALGEASIADSLLAVHRSYLSCIRSVRSMDGLHGLTHVTGGGIPGNIARVVREPHTAVVDYSAWPRPPIFELIQHSGDVPEEDMRRTFNLGIGLIAIVEAAHADSLRERWIGTGESPVFIGHVE